MSNEHFNLIAGVYNRVSKFSQSGTMLKALALPEKEAVLLDVGGGTGRVLEALRDSVRMGIVLDVSMGMMKYAIEKGLHCVNAPVEALPFQTGGIDKLIMVDAFHHVRHQGQTAVELYRVIRPGGRLVIVEPDIHHLGVKLVSLGERLLLMRSKFLTGEEIAKLFRGLGGEVVYWVEGHAVIILVMKV